MTSEQEIMSFEKRLEHRNFVLDDKLLEQLVAAKMQRLREQIEQNEKLRRLIKRK